jgi:hypothetical protein
MLFLSTITWVSALDMDDVLFSASFDKGFDADISKGKNKASVNGEPKLVPGRKGKALKVRNGKDFLAYALKDNLNPSQGTISFWLSAGDNWDGSMGKALQVLMHTGVHSPQKLVIQTLWPWSGVMSMMYNNGTPIGGFPACRSVSAPVKLSDDLMSVLRPGEWYHYLITWRDGYMAIYLNGKRMNYMKHVGVQMRRPGYKFFIGWDKKNAPVFFDPGCEKTAQPLADTPWESLLDDVTILRTFVSDKQAEKIFKQGALEYAKLAEPSDMDIEAEFYQTPANLEVKLLAPGREVKKGEVLIIDVDNKTVKNIPFEMSAEEYDKTFAVDLKTLPLGKYRAKAKLATGFETDATEFEKVHPEWMGNQLGAGDVVLPPWMPIKVAQGEKDVTVSVWGREYKFNGPLPESILSQKESILTAPVNWFYGKKSVPVIWSKPEVVSSSPTKVELSSVGKLGAYEIKAVTRIEYDGMVWSEFNFKSDKAQSIDKAFVDIPLSKENCVFLQHRNRRDNWFPKKSWSRAFEPYLLVSNDKAGIEWFAESDQWWHAAEPQKALEVSMTKKGGNIRLNIINDPIEMPKEFKISFGLMATPVRPRPKKWRGYGNNNPYRMGRPEIFTPMALDYSWWSITPGALIPNYEDKKHRRYPKPMLWLPFTSGTFRGARYFGEKDLYKLLPEWKQFAPEWRNVPVRVDLRSKPGWNEARIIPSKSYTQKYAWEVNEFFKNYDPDGLYFDGYPSKDISSALNAGFGYIDRDGSVKPTWPILAGREFMRRVYALISKYRPNGVIMLHPSNCLIVPVMSFSHSIYDGEFMGWSDIRAKMKKGGLRAGLSDDKLRVIFSYKMLGHIPTIDTRFVHRNVQGERLKKARMIMGLFLLNDIHGWGSVDGYNQVMTYPIDWWGIADPDVEFHGYWEQNPAADAGWASRSSAYVNPKKNTALIITLNDSGYSRNPERFAKEGKYNYDLKLNLEKLGFEPGKFRAYNVESLGKLEFPVKDGNIIPLTMYGQQVRLIGLEKIK